MSKKVNDAILKLVASQQDGILMIHKGDIAKRAKLTNCKLVDIEASLKWLVSKRKLSCSTDQESKRLVLEVL